ncbi:MAG TPA: alpha/beta hydrolase [Gemmatimonadaceae bacterium]|nr:alpha/beta hydrolase [Gemmatimonadaceae bacterium]
MKPTTRRSALVTGALLAIIAMFAFASSATSQQASRRVGGRHAFVNGLNMYYLVQGSGGIPLVLLHGAFSNIQTDFGKMLPTLAKNRQVIAIEQQGHGHTPDMDRPLTYEQMADDVAELLRQLRITKADFFGYSMGGAIGTYVAIRHPELVRKLVFAGGASYNVAGFYPELMEGEKKMKPEDFAGTPWLKAYTRIAPHPGDWPKLVTKIKDLDVNWRGLSDDQLRSIKVPTLLIVGDADVVRPEHVVQMFRLLGGGVPGDLVGLPRSQLAVLPGTTHVTLITKTDWLLSMVRPFLDAPLPKAK